MGIPAILPKKNSTTGISCENSLEYLWTTAFDKRTFPMEEVLTFSLLTLNSYLFFVIISVE